MMKNKIYTASLKNVGRAVDILKSGGVIIYPTDTLYGFGVDASNKAAINMLNRIKNRIQPLSILLKNKNEIYNYGIVNSNAKDKLLEILPGPYTLLMKSKFNQNISDLVQAGSDLTGLRVIDVEFCNKIITQLGSPIVTTSVNKHGMPSITHLDEMQKIFPSITIFYNKKNLISNGSTIIDFSQTPEKIIRWGQGRYKK